MSKKWLKDIKAIGWDLDGTLYPNSDAMNKAITDLQLELISKENKIGVDEARRKYKDVYQKLGSNTKTMTELGVDGPKFFVDMWSSLPLSNFIKKDDGVSKMFGSLAKYRHFLLSNSNTMEHISKKLALIGLDESVFEFMVSTVELGSVKPDPEPFNHCLEKLGLEAHQVLYVGDRETTDVNGAKGVGMMACMVWGESQVADVSLETVYDVVELLG